ncbi:porin [Martelella alba]|uniref:Porin OmpC n=1 Tax=Martelella alba TaxID=2590451 RepID=A0ABY2SLJ9_9HYPH|nr:porin [Martelella alba]TKI06064.1 porin OmpC [Martelella alba]
MIAKKSTIALLILAGATSVQAAEIYNKDGNQLLLTGAVHTRYYSSNDTSLDGNNTFIRFGFKGRTQINDWMSGYAQWETNIQANHTESGSDVQTGNATRLAYAGLNIGRYDSVDYGRNWGIDYDVASFTDYAPIFNNLTYSGGDNFMTGRGTGMLTWRNRNAYGLVKGLNLALQYQGANDDNSNNATGRPVIKQNGEGYGVSAAYNITDSITFAGAYSSSKRTADQQELELGKGKDAQIWTAGIKYAGPKLYMASIYAQTYNLTPIKSLGFANKTRDWEAVAGYLFDSGIKPQVGYFWSKATQVEGYGDVALMRYIDLAVMYYLNDNMVTYVDYKINQLGDNTALGITNDNVIGFGLTYHF